MSFLKKLVKKSPAAKLAKASGDPLAKKLMKSGSPTNKSIGKVQINKPTTKTAAMSAIKSSLQRRSPLR